MKKGGVAVLDYILEPRIHRKVFYKKQHRLEPWSFFHRKTGWRCFVFFFKDRSDLRWFVLKWLRIAGFYLICNYFLAICKIWSHLIIAFLTPLGPRTWWWLFGGIFRSCRAHWRDGVPQQKLDPAKGDGQWRYIWVFPKIGVPPNGWFILENPIRMDDWGVPLFSETSIYSSWLWLSKIWMV